MKILIIGGSGFLGRNIVKNLIQKKHKVIVLDKVKSNFKNSNLIFIKGDINNYGLLEKIIKNKVDVIYNFAAIADIDEAMRKPLQTIEVNILGNIKVLELCKKYKTKRYIFASTVYVHSSQGGFYKVSKQSSELFIEEYFKRHKVNYTILRYGSVFGPGASENNGISKILYKALKYNKLEYSGTQKAVRKFIHVKDAAELSVSCLSSKFKNKNLLITGNKIYKIKYVLKLISQKFKIKSKLIFKNKKNKGHYDYSPYSYKPKKDIIYSNKKNNILENSLDEIAREIKFRFKLK
jgi:UDP-glucose 4-epimerase